MKFVWCLHQTTGAKLHSLPHITINYIEEIMVDIVRDQPPEFDENGDRIYYHAHTPSEVNKYAEVLITYAAEPDKQFCEALELLAGAYTLYESLGLKDKQKPIDEAIGRISHEMEEYVSWLEDELYACSGKKKERPVFVFNEGIQS